MAQSASPERSSNPTEITATCIGWLTLSDQQLGGLIMWVPADIVMMLFGLAMFAAWLGESERRRQRGWS
jgi:cytochrome c oxidase assembly factor CtaG